VQQPKAIRLCRETAKHASDENRHGQIFANALKQLNKQVIDKSLPQQNRRISRMSGGAAFFFEAYFGGTRQSSSKQYG